MGYLPPSAPGQPHSGSLLPLAVACLLLFVAFAFYVAVLLSVQ